MNRGTVHQRGRKWFLQLATDELDPSTGEIRRVRPRVELGTIQELRSRAAARDAADRWLYRKANQTLQPGPKIMAAAYFAEFLRRTVSLWRKSSRRLYTSVINCHLIPAFKGPLSDITPKELRELLARLVREGRRRHTVSNVRSVALRVLRQAEADGYRVHRIDAKTVRLPSETHAKTEQRWLTAEQILQVIEASELPWLALWSIVGRMGLRISEALGVTWNHVDLEELTLKVRLSAVLGELQPPKTKTSIADLPIPDEVGDILKAYRPVWVPNRAGLLFASRNGTALRADDVRRRRLQPLLKRLGIPRAGFHAFRHGLPRELLKNGVSPAVVQRLLRHASLQMTSTYTHTAADDLRAAVKAGGLRKAKSDQPQNTL